MTQSDTVMDAARKTFAEQKKLAERAIAQITDAQLFERQETDANSIGALMKHVGGNLSSRWRDFLDSDGEKSDRDRDGEFEPDTDTPASIRATWDAGWATLEATLASLTDADLGRTITIRTEPLSAGLALQRSLAHTAQHVGQIILLARIMKGAEWQTLSIARGESKAFNENLLKQHRP
ncbi:MAG: DUF1572 family protein [Longimicrobiales bacterium]